MSEEIELTPEELQKTLIGFLGHTYKEISQFDSRLVSPNNTLMPKKKEFQNIANKVFQEVVSAPNSGQFPVGNIQHIQPNHQNVQPTNQIIHPQPPLVDPNQLEFNFNNSVTALSIDKRLTDIENRIKKIDITLLKVLSLLESNDFTNLKQE